jgi:glyoxylase-like metal-dependent hydrolase (beta-lactamase superfamily II)
MRVIPLSEGSFTIDKTKVFVPFQKGTDDLQDRSIGSLLVEVQPFVVITEKDVLLLDGGLGFSVNGSLQLYHNLREHNIAPEHITKVLMTHLHKDHAGGITRKDHLGNYHLSFPNATYYIQAEELAYAFDIGFPSYLTEELMVLQNHPQVQLLHGNGTIDAYIRYEVTGAHSKFHQVFWITENDDVFFFGGDDAPQLGQMRKRYSAKYDFDGKLAMELRHEWWEQGQREGWTFLFYHDVKHPYYSWKL